MQNPKALKAPNNTQLALRAALGPGFQAAAVEGILRVAVQSPVQR